MRDNKITACGPISSKNYLKKNIISQWKPGHSMIEDYIEYSVAKKACIKANTEGRIELLAELKELFYKQLQSPTILTNAKVLHILNELENKVNANKQ